MQHFLTQHFYCLVPAQPHLIVWKVNSKYFPFSTNFQTQYFCSAISSTFYYQHYLSDATYIFHYRRFIPTIFLSSSFLLAVSHISLFNISIVRSQLFVFQPNFFFLIKVYSKYFPFSKKFLIELANYIHSFVLHTIICVY